MLLMLLQRVIVGLMVVLMREHPGRVVGRDVEGAVEAQAQVGDLEPRSLGEECPQALRKSAFGVGMFDRVPLVLLLRLLLQSGGNPVRAVGGGGDDGGLCARGVDVLVFVYGCIEKVIDIPPRLYLEVAVVEHYAGAVCGLQDPSPPRRREHVGEDRVGLGAEDAYPERLPRLGVRDGIDQSSERGYSQGPASFEPQTAHMQLLHALLREVGALAQRAPDRRLHIRRRHGRRVFVKVDAHHHRLHVGQEQGPLGGLEQALCVLLPLHLLPEQKLRRARRWVARRLHVAGSRPRALDAVFW